MADSTTWLESLSASDSQKEIVANELFDAASPGTLYGRHAEACSGLTWGYYGGRVWDGTAALLIANGTLTLTNNATNYIEASLGSPFGTVSANTSGFTSGAFRIAKVTTVSGAVTAYEDHRCFTLGGGATAPGLGSVTSVALSLPAEFSVSGSPVTTAGTLTGAKATQTANTVWAGPTAGSAAQPSFRGLVAADLPTFVGDDGGSPDTSVKGAVPAAHTGDAAAGRFLKADGTWATPAGTASGTVTSVNITQPAAGITATGGPVTTTGAITLALANDLAALEGVSGTGYAKRTGTDAWSLQSTIPATDVAVFIGDDGGSPDSSVKGLVPAANQGDAAAGKYLFADGTWKESYLPQNSKSAAYTTLRGDAGKHLLHPSADTTARTFTIDSNANVAYPIGTAITFVNQASAGVMTIAITSDTMRLAGAGTTGSRTLAANGIATALKVTSTEWIISGTGLT